MRLSRLIVVAAAALALVRSLPAVDYTVTVGSGVTNTVDAALVSSIGAADRLVKRGSGVLEATPLLSSYAGEIVVEEGVLLVRETGALGTSAGATVISNGASIVFNATSGNNCKFYSESFSFAGAGAPGEGGAFVNLGAGLTGQSIRYLTLLDDAVIYAWGELSLYAGRLNMNGKRLSIYVRNKTSTNATTWDYSFTFNRSRVINPGHIVLETGRLAIAGQTLSDGTAVWDGDETNTLTVRPLARLQLTSSLTKLPWKLILEDSSGVYPAGNASASSISNNAWCGPVELKGDIPFSYTSSQKGTINLLGPVSGVGGLHWSGHVPMHLHGVGSFEGAVKATADAENDTVLTLHNGRALPPDGKGLTLVDSNLPLEGEDVYELPNVHFTNNIARTISGAVSGGTMAGLVKSGVGTLLLEAPLAITGTLHIAAGEVRIPSMTVREQAGGVIEGTTNFVNSSSGDSCWNNYYASAPMDETVVGSVRCPYLTKQEQWRDRIVGIRYTGYLWNDSETNETWSFMTGVQRRSRLFVNGKNVLSKSSWGCQLSYQYAVFGQAELKPGPNAFVYYMEVTAYETGGGGSTLSRVVDFDGSFHDTPLQDAATSDFKWVLLKGLAFNRCGTKSHDEADYEKFENLRDGSLMTFTDDLSGLRPKARADVSKLVCDPGTTLDLSDAASVLEVDEYSGTAWVPKGSIRVRSKMLLNSRYVSQTALFDDGRIEFAPGAVVDVDDPNALDRTRDENFPYEIALCSEEIAEAPATSPALRAKGWVTRLSEDGKSIQLYHVRRAMAVLLR